MELDRTREEPLLDVKERLEVDEAREEPLLVHEDEALVRHLLETRATPSWMPLMIVASAGIALSADVPLLPAMMARFGKGPRGVAWWVGVAQGCYSAAQFVSSPLIGHCSDVRGRRPFVLGALATSCAATLLCGFASSAAQVVGLRVLAGLTNNNAAAPPPAPAARWRC
ncbi:amidohydrolase [Aureococcus anophagefferens]|nr:amidohydrolase [Aureococcus anophagefferens]